MRVLRLIQNTPFVFYRLARLEFLAEFPAYGEYVDYAVHGKPSKEVAGLGDEFPSPAFWKTLNEKIVTRGVQSSVIVSDL